MKNAACRDHIEIAKHLSHLTAPVNPPDAVLEPAPENRGAAVDAMSQPSEPAIFTAAYGIRSPEIVHISALLLIGILSLLAFVKLPEGAVIPFRGVAISKGVFGILGVLAVSMTLAALMHSDEPPGRLRVYRDRIVVPGFEILRFKDVVEYCLPGNLTRFSISLRAPGRQSLSIERDHMKPGDFEMLEAVLRGILVVEKG